MSSFIDRLNLSKELILFGLIIAVIGTPLSYLAMRIERKEKDIGLSCMSWVRIFITFVITGVLAQLLIENVLQK